MIVMQIQNNITFLICLLSVITSFFFLLLTRNTIGIILSTLVTSLIGFAIENRVRKYAKDPDKTWILGKIKRPRITKTTVEDMEGDNAPDEEQQLNSELHDGDK